MDTIITITTTSKCLKVRATAVRDQETYGDVEAISERPLKKKLLSRNSLTKVFSSLKGKIRRFFSICFFKRLQAAQYILSLKSVNTLMMIASRLLCDDRRSNSI